MSGGGGGSALAERQRRFSDGARRRWYVLASLLPAFIAAILLGVWASVGAWWLWPIAVALALPPLLIVWPRLGEGNGEAWHLRQFHRPE